MSEFQDIKTAMRAHLDLDRPGRGEPGRVLDGPVWILDPRLSDEMPGYVQRDPDGDFGGDLILLLGRRAPLSEAQERGWRFRPRQVRKARP